MPKPVLDRAWRFLRSNMLGLIAIFIALSGVAVALPGKNKIDSGDIKQGQVRTLDLHRGAVTRAKLHRNAVDSSKVGNNSLTGDDIDESRLEFELGQGAVGEREEADRERRVVISPGELVPATEEDPQVFLSFAMPAVQFDPDTDDSVGTIVEVPLDRAAGSGLQVRLLWDANGIGNAAWNVGFRTHAAGESLLKAAAPKGTDAVASSPAQHTLVETTVLNIPPGAMKNGLPLILFISRNADAPSDTLPVVSFLRLVEIRYTATG